MLERFILILFISAAVAFDAGCSRNLELRREALEPVDDYRAVLHRSTQGNLLLSLFKNGTQWDNYPKVMVDPVELVILPDADIGHVAHADFYEIGEAIDYKVRSLLKKSFVPKRQPGPGILRVKFSINVAAASTGYPTGLSAFYPERDGLAKLDRLLEGDKFQPGNAVIESMLIDSETGEVLAATFDRCTVGTKFFGPDTIWEDLERSIDFWTRTIGYELCLIKSRQPCSPP
ncbi:MAG: DUF3313 family protein [Gammaproteobacteria bacterium]